MGRVKNLLMVYQRNQSTDFTDYADKLIDNTNICIPHRLFWLMQIIQHKPFALCSDRISRQDFFQFRLGIQLIGSGYKKIIPAGDQFRELRLRIDTRALACVKPLTYGHNTIFRQP